MLDTRLVFVEGLPGSGKTTTSQYIVGRLQRLQFPATWLPEVQDNHPLNVGGALHPAGATTGAELFATYTVEAYIAESLQRWQAFVAVPNDGLTVLDSYPYQNSVRILLQMDAPLATLLTYAREVESLVQPLAPVLVYLNRAVTDEALSATLRLRGDAWTAYAMEVMTNCPYAHHRQLTGPAGAKALLDAYNAVLHELLAESALPRLMLEQCDGHWDACYARLAAFLGFPADTAIT
jgi:hypothetical protein